MRGDYKGRQMRYGQCVLLGIEITRDHSYRPGILDRWRFALPPGLKPVRGYVAGYFKRRWECVEAALRTIGVDT